MSVDKFLHPISAIKVISRAPIRTLLTDEAIEAGRKRVAAGEDIEKVALDLAKMEVELLDDGEDDDEELSALGGPGSGNFGHSGRPGERGGSGDSDAANQEDLASKQSHPLANPDFVIGGSNNPAVRRYVAAYGEEHRSAPLPDDVERGTPRECYKNASLLVMRREDLTYAEGFAQSGQLTHDLTFQHAWAVTKDGTVVDPTWEHPEKCKYFGVRYERKAYLKYLYKAKMYGVLGSTEKNARRAVETGVPELRAKNIKTLGGPGSGNFGHAGRPGQVGGSSSEGGSAHSESNKHEAQLKKSSSHYEPSRPDGLDTRERFSDSHGHYTPERMKLHEAIIDKYLKNTTPVEKPSSIILGGGPASGKSTIVESEGIGKENTVLVNVDDIRTDLPEYREGVGKNKHISAFTHEESSHIAKRLTERALSQKHNVVLDGTGDSSIEKLGGKAAAMRAAGHQVIG